MFKIVAFALAFSGLCLCLPARADDAEDFQNAKSSSNQGESSHTSFAVVSRETSTPRAIPPLSGRPDSED